jgi:hypothetical protein
MCVTDGCLVLPRQIRTIRAAWICDTPARFVNEFYEAIGWESGGWGKLSEDDSLDIATIIDRGTVPVMQNVINATTAAPKKIQVVASDPSDNGKTITLRYVDSNGNAKRTSIGGTYQDGEQLTLSTTGTLTSSTVLNGGLYHIVKAVTNFPVRVYAYDTVSLAQTQLLSVYDPSETAPIYRKLLIPGLSSMNGCSAGDATTDPKAVTVIARLQHVPVIVDNDPLIIGNIGALADMVQSIKMREERNFAEAERLEASAMRELDGELSAFMGDGMKISIQVPEASVWGPSVLNCI